VSQRRGGNRIYSLDVTNRNAPKLEWIIEGGGPSSNPYHELGQSWSSVNLEQVKDATSTSGSKPVLIFSGGYDVGQDDNSATGIQRHVDAVGRTVFIADAITGEQLWSARADLSASLSSMKYSMPARVKPLDMNGDGNIDRLYAVDMGGQIFRFDIDETTTSFNPALITGGLFADLAEDGSAANARRFYYPPDVALVADKGKAAYLGIAISSGYRAHPNNEDIQDRIYLLKDKNVFDAPGSYTALTEADLYDATVNLASLPTSPAPTQLQIDASKSAVDDISSKEGWFIKLDDETPAGLFVGEKGLAEPLIVEGTMIVTTFIPNNTPTPGSCISQSGSGKVFYLDIQDATAAYPSNLDTREDRHIDLKKSGIPASPTVIITKDNAPTTCIGTECSSLSTQVGARRTFWYEVEK
jgi:type IV pilus assembly protein PilY1